MNRVRIDRGVNRCVRKERRIFIEVGVNTNCLFSDKKGTG